MSWSQLTSDDARRSGPLSSAPAGPLLSGPAPDGPGLHPGGAGTAVEEEVRPRPVPTDAGDHERFAHYAPKDKIMEAMVTGTPVRALCGKVWVPSRDPARFPLCPTCKEIYDRMPGGHDDEGD
jgi:hypothetical protein